MTMYRWILTTAMAFSSVALACDSGNGDDGSDASGNDEETSDAEDEDGDGEESGEDSSSTSSSSSTTTSSTTSDDDGPEPGDSVYATQIQPIWTENCMGASCHEGLFPPNLTEGGSYEAIVNVQAPAGMKPFVVPGDADASYLFQKLLGADGISGDRMPWLLPPLPESELSVIEDWINSGAPE